MSKRKKQIKTPVEIVPVEIIPDEPEWSNPLPHSARKEPLTRYGLEKCIEGIEASYKVNPFMFQSDADRLPELREMSVKDAWLLEEEDFAEKVKGMRAYEHETIYGQPYTFFYDKKEELQAWINVRGERWIYE